MHFRRTEKKLIIFRLLDFDQGMIDFLFETSGSFRLRDSPEILLEDCWDLEREKQILARAALDIWSGCGNVFLWEILNELHDPNFHRLIFAAKEIRDLNQQRETTVRRSLE